MPFFRLIYVPFCLGSLWPFKWLDIKVLYRDRPLSLLISLPDEVTPLGQEWRQRPFLELLTPAQFSSPCYTKWIPWVEAYPNWQCSQYPKCCAYMQPSGPAMFRFLSANLRPDKSSSEELLLFYYNLLKMKFIIGALLIIPFILPWMFPALFQDPIQLCQQQCPQCPFQWQGTQ